MSRVCHDGPSDERPISVLYHGDPPSTRILTETETTSRTKKLRKRLHGVRRIGIEDMRRQIAQVEAIVFLDSVPRRSGPIGCCPEEAAALPARRGSPVPDFGGGWRLDTLMRNNQLMGSPLHDVGVTWFREEDYPALLQVFEDGDMMPRTWKLWLGKAEQMERQARALGYNT
jgi:hypothetical protein